MPDRTFNTTAAGWPVLDNENYVDAIVDWSVQLTTKLQNGEAAVARAENAATRAETAAAALNDTGWKPLTLAAGLTGTCFYRVAAGVVYLSGRVTRTAGNWPINTFVTIANWPAGATPSKSGGYVLSCDRFANVHAMYLSSTNLQLKTAATSSEVDLDSVYYRTGV